MLPRLANALTNSGRAVVSFRHRLFRKTRESEQGIVAQHCLVRAAKRIDDRQIAPTSEQESLDCPEFIRTQSQLMTTMLEFMVIACGENVDGSARRNGSKPQRSPAPAPEKQNL